jgi:hypothetical protein
MARASGSVGDTFRNALRTTAVMGALLLGLVLVGQLVTVTPERSESEVDLADAVTGAQATATFDVLAPRGMPDGWIATSARFTSDAWHLGVLTDDDKYIGLEQTTTSAKTIIDDFAPRSRTVREVQVAGDEWQLRTEADGDRVYVRDVGDTSVLVVGSAGRADMERYLSSLSSDPAGS